MGRIAHFRTRPNILWLVIKGYYKQKYNIKYIICLVGGFKHVLFSIVYGMSSFPLTKSIIFQDGYCTTDQIGFYMVYIIHIPVLTTINHHYPLLSTINHHFPMVFLWLNQVISLALPSIPVTGRKPPRCWDLHVSSVDWLTTPCPLELEPFLAKNPLHLSNV